MHKPQQLQQLFILAFIAETTFERTFRLIDLAYKDQLKPFLENFLMGACQYLPDGNARNLSLCHHFHPEIADAHTHYVLT